MSDESKQILVDLNTNYEALQKKLADNDAEVKRLGSVDVISRDEFDKIKQDLMETSAKNDALVLDLKRRSHGSRRQWQ